MTQLSIILKESIGKKTSDMAQFFQQMIDRNELRAYLIEVDKKTVEKDTEEEEIIRIKKGATLIPTKELRENQPVFIEDSETGVKYNLNIETRGGEFFKDGDSQTMHHSCILEKLVNFNPRKITEKVIFGSYRQRDFSIPQEMIAARLIVNYEEDWESSGDSDYVAEARGNIVVEGEQDILFKKVYDFVKST